MRVPSPLIAGGLVALLVTLLLSFIGGAALRASTDEAGVLWRRADAATTAVWVASSAHGVPIDVEAGIGASDALGRIADRVGGIFGRDIETRASVGLRLRMVPLTVLLAAAAAAFLTASRSGTWSRSEVVVGAIGGGLLHGGSLALLAATARSEIGFSGRLVQAGVEASVSPGAALASGTVWIGLALAAGGMHAMRGQVPWTVRSLADGWWHGVVVAAAGTALGLAVWALSGLGRADPPPADLMGAGVFLAGATAVATGLVASHGAPILLSLSVGPFAGWERIGYGSFGASGDPAPLPWWLFLLVPLVATVVAGRSMGTRAPASWNLAVGFGAVWGVTLVALAWLSRVEVLTSFAIGDLGAGGTARIPVAVAVVLGAAWGTLGSYVGMRMTPKADRLPV